MLLRVKLSTTYVDRVVAEQQSLPAYGLLSTSWPAPQTLRDALVSEGDSSRAPSHSALSAALFAACLASRSDDAAAVLRVIESRGGGIADVWDENGRTPLHHVCRADDVGMARVLCRAGADTAARDCQVRLQLRSILS